MLLIFLSAKTVLTLQKTVESQCLAGAREVHCKGTSYKADRITLHSMQEADLLTMRTSDCPTDCYSMQAASDLM